MRKIITGAVAFGLAIVSGAAVAQMQGPGSPNYSTGGPNGPPTTSNTQTAQPTNPNAGQGTLYNYAPGQRIIRRSPNSVVEPPATNTKTSQHP